MKKILLIATLFFSLSGNAQTIHLDSNISMCYVFIKPVKWVRNADSVTRLYIKAINDNLVNYGQLYWELRDEHNNVIDRGNKDIVGEDYEAWDPLSQYLFEMMCKSENLNLELAE